MRPQVFIGEGLRWYLKKANHPFKPYIVGHYWQWFCKPRVWINYDNASTISVRLGDYLQQRIFFDGYYERPLIDWLKRTLTRDDVFWDIGANIGAVTLVASSLCKRVVAFEPDPRSLESLKRHLEANHIENVDIVAAALGLEQGEATLYQSAPVNTGMTSLLSGRGAVASQVRVQVLRADNLLLARPNLMPTVVKIDVEGAEHLVLAGAVKMLQSHALRTVVFEDQSDRNLRPTNVEVVRRLCEAGFTIEPLGASDQVANDGMLNFVATRTNASVSKQ